LRVGPSCIRRSTDGDCDEQPVQSSRPSPIITLGLSAERYASSHVDRVVSEPEISSR
jgi:hypothetical protein